MTVRPWHSAGIAALVVASSLLTACAVGSEGLPDTAVDDIGGIDGGATCSGNSDCTSPTRFCDPTSHRCVECLTNTDSCPSGQVCDPNSLHCVMGCRQESDCRTDGGVRDAGLLPDGGLPPIGEGHCDTANRRCVQCTTDDHCPAGAVCMRNACVLGCSAAHPCPAGRMCCSGVCADTQQDPRNCGACGRACDTANNACCAGRCANTMTDSANCGGCGRACMVSHATARCMGGGCSIAMCEMGWSDADGMSANGCECAADSASNSCSSATDIGSVAVGTMQMLQGNLLPTGSSDWYRVAFATGGHPHVRFATNPGNNHRVDVQSTCLSSDVLSCMDSGGSSTSLTDWEFFDTTDMMHSSRNTPAPTSLVVRVFSPMGIRVCQNYQLVISN